MTDTVDLVEVRIVAMPLDAYREASEHSDELMREFALIHATDASVPRRLLELVERLRNEFSGFTIEQDTDLHDALDRGDESIDLVYRVPREVKQAAVELAVLLDEADQFCREGNDLLTLATPPRAVAFRRWFLDQFARQIDGLEPSRWEEPTPAP
jgi:hypothetical protein